MPWPIPFPFPRFVSDNRMANRQGRRLDRAGKNSTGKLSAARLKTRRTIVSYSRTERIHSQYSLAV